MPLSREDPRKRMKDGYWIGLGASDTHMFNWTIIGNDIYKIEARTDNIEPWLEVD